MAHYIQVSADIYAIYLQYIAPEDIHVYSIDEVFIDVTPYLKTYGLTARELAMRIIRDILQTTGITANLSFALFKRQKYKLFRISSQSNSVKLYELSNFRRLGFGSSSKDVLPSRLS